MSSTSDSSSAFVSSSSPLISDGAGVLGSEVLGSSSGCPSMRPHSARVVVFDALCRGAPKLEELDLAPDPPFLTRSTLDRSTAIEGDLAALRVIRLDQCYLPVDCFLFHPGLTHLRLSGTRAVWPALERLLSTLSLIPKLQVLELYGVLPTPQSSPDPAPTPDRPLLPLLQELHLGGTAQCVLAVLQALELPERVRVYVGVPDVPTEDGSPSRLVTKLRVKQGSGPEPSHSSH
ncbi:hypothetical protein EDB92DRAFT_1939716 [Lactarius akahatsu]|uniref:Uncharacterized protein n=1 Tax=Lactarius akahatsu TaxID=416441 RepID=A0AAD4QEZ3_9AGAM|nr:hypothetical protein EDB92DRAFT_1939716 [Lactarius akahatsu]